ncbi:hypothetical protein F5878DRAFT_611900 [Lentinula raphanica]|uniref:F-box domain-containing protein n=1 Tax=Lentinula raphanica TaxID=153919 RepID=A0AA38PDR8_9AGAR|nr:hypothetical protein F5878DRAFT_611900 [Lentinula raphanica]
MVFPVEILDIILSFIDDVHSYSNLALSSSILLRLSRPLHFQSITIKPTNANKLSEVLASPYQTILGNIQEIHLIDGQMCLEQHDLLRLIASSNGQTVRSMILEYCLDPHHHIYKGFLSEFPNLLSIKIDSVVFPSVTQVMQILGSFRFLKTACLNNVDWAPYNTLDASLHYDIPSSLRKFTLWYCCKRDILECFMSCDTPPAISELDLGVISPADTEAIGRYLRRLGRSLTSLSLGFSSLDAGGDAEDFYLNCDLSLNTRLQTITFQHFFLIFMEYRFSDPWPWISKIISSMRSDALTTITFSLPTWSPMLLSAINFEWCETMDRFFSEGLAMLPRFKTLQFHVQFRCDEQCDYDIVSDFISMIRKSLPRCDKTGLLEFVVQEM